MRILMIALLNDIAVRFLISLIKSSLVLQNSLHTNDIYVEGCDINRSSFIILLLDCILIVCSMKKKTIGGKYVFELSTIGEGREGKVHKGIILETKEVIAVKVIDTTKFAKEDQKYLERALIRQIQIFKLLKSQNIIKFIDILQTKKGHVYIIQQYANQGTLTNLIEGKCVEEEVAINYLTQIVNGMAEMVSNGLIHRDLKPDNIVIKDGVLKIVDFGRSRKIQYNEIAYSSVGTPVYMAPEVIINDEYTYKCDIWSLGVLCYQMVTGQIPWTKAKNIKQLYEKIKQFTIQGVQFPAHINISPSFKGFIRHCLEFFQYDRFDWMKIFLHPIFKGKFKASVLQNEDLLSGFAITKLRKSIHEQNLDLITLFEELPEEIDQQNFRILVQTLESSLTEEETTYIYKSICRQNFVRKQQIFNYFQKSGISIKGIPIEQMNRKYSYYTNNNLRKTIERLCKIIKQRKIDMFDLFFHKQNFQNAKQTALNHQKFNKIMLHIDPSLDQKTLDQLFIDFDVNKDGMVSYTELYAKLCKINRIIMIKNRPMAETLKKVFKIGNKKPEKLAISSK